MWVDGTNRINWSNKENHIIARMTGLGRYHGSASDRGGADRYYGRGRDPHYYPNGTGNDPKVEAKDMTEEEIAAYNKAFDEETDRKDWG